MLRKLVTISQKFHPPFFSGNVKIDLTFCYTEFGEGDKQAIGMSVTATVKFILILSFGWTLNMTSGAYSPCCRKHSWREYRNDIDHEV